MLKRGYLSRKRSLFENALRPAGGLKTPACLWRVNGPVQYSTVHAQHCSPDKIEKIERKIPTNCEIIRTSQSERREFVNVSFVTTRFISASACFRLPVCFQFRISSKGNALNVSREESSTVTAFQERHLSSPTYFPVFIKRTGFSYHIWYPQVHVENSTLLTPSGSANLFLSFPLYAPDLRFICMLLVHWSTT